MQRALFDNPPEEPPQESAAPESTAVQRVAGVVVPGPVDRVFDYLVPPGLYDAVEVGRRLKAPFGKGDKPTIGTCVSLEDRVVTGRRLKCIAEVLDQRALLDQAMLDLTRWIADRWACSWGQVLETVVPAGVRAQSGTREVRLLSLAEGVEESVLQELPLKQKRAALTLRDHLEALTAAELGRLAGCTLAPIQALLEKGILTSRRERTRTMTPPPVHDAWQADLKLNPAQELALHSIQTALRQQRHETFLLHGVTGSGKTEIYLQAIAQVVASGRQAILLVPEISLTPQTVDRFRARFGETAVLHSHLTDSERHWHWERIAEGRVPVVVGARSAVFAPTPRLGLIVLDEEHETTFKQESAPRYHARDVAMERAKREAAPLILGSATPSLESWLAASRGEYRRLSLPERVADRPLPPVGLIDLRQEDRRGPRGALSRPLRDAMHQALDAGGQVILLLNRRGYSTHLQCPDCGHVMQCEHCDVALTYHRADELLLCHYCDFQQALPQRCPECKTTGIRYGGLGTQKLELEVQAAFPEERCIRMDADAMHGPGAHAMALAAFERGDARILLGTQMIAKGLDFPQVTLVGVVNADVGLHLPDFRASERTFQLISQVAGRAGRGDRPGRVLVQTYTPDHPALQAAVRHDYVGFAQGELPQREAFLYPPYGHMTRIVARGPDSAKTAELASGLAECARERLKTTSPAARLLGPAPAPIPRLRDRFRFHLQLQGPERGKLVEAVRELNERFPQREEYEWIADVDPVSML